jgi:hypothetical protein
MTLMTVKESVTVNLKTTSIKLGVYNEPEKKISNNSYTCRANVFFMLSIV